jgi:hypothetical protein
MCLPKLLEKRLVYEVAHVPEIISTGVQINWNRGQEKAMMALSTWFTRSDIYTGGFGSGLATEVVPTEQQTPMEITIGQKDISSDAEDLLRSPTKTPPK